MQDYQFNKLIHPNMLLELCTFCQRAVVDEAGKKTEDFGQLTKGKYMCSKCMKAFEFSIGH
jgi:hypothetical protein